MTYFFTLTNFFEILFTKLEKDSHPCKELHEFDAYPRLIARIEKLEKLIK